MSELKAINLNSMGSYNINEPIYLKSEADKVFAELEADYKETRDRLQTANLIKDEQLAAARHQKYKRCLAMALWCSAEIGILDFFCGPKIKYYKRWQKRWFKIAEQFKEAK